MKIYNKIYIYIYIYKINILFILDHLCNDFFFFQNSQTCEFWKKNQDDCSINFINCFHKIFSQTKQRDNNSSIG